MNVPRSNLEIFSYFDSDCKIHYAVLEITPSPTGKNSVTLHYGSESHKVGAEWDRDQIGRNDMAVAVRSTLQRIIDHAA